MEAYIRYEHKGIKYTVKELAEIFGYSVTNMRTRIYTYPLDKALQKKQPRAKKYEYLGKEYTIKELSELSGVSVSGLRSRIKKGFSIDRVIGIKNKYYD